jgi:fructoselysine-6-P-deglycase FrlB-like protein
MSIAHIIDQALARAGGQDGIRQVFLVACGGSLVDMYPAKTFLETEARSLRGALYTANEFVNMPPRALSSSSVVIVCSHSGDTPESVAAVRLAHEAKAFCITLSNNPEGAISAQADHAITYQWGDVVPVTDNPITIILSLCVELLHRIEGYDAYADFQQALAMIDELVAAARQQVAARAARFGEIWRDEPLFYILSSGASFGHAYGFAICSLMEMQWRDAAAIHSGEYFHGPFEVTDHDKAYILLINEGRTRPLDERARVFLERYARKLEIIDARELGLGALPASVVDYFNPVLFYVMSCVYRAALAEVRQHPLETRRYMGKVSY